MSKGMESGDSSTATGIRNWARSRILGYSKQQFSIAGLITVPDHFRKLDEQAFTPRLISIGPIHSSNAKLQNMREIKIEFCRCRFQRCNLDYNLFEDKIREKEEEIRSYYVETIVSSISSDDFVTMILVDGIFILEYIYRRLNPHLVGDDPMTKIAEWMPPILEFDLVLLENQLPFFVIEMLFEQARFLDGYDEGISLPLKELAFQFFGRHNFQRVDFAEFPAKIEHFTDLVRSFFLRGNLPNRENERAKRTKLSYSATQLQEVGVKFKGVKFVERMQRYTGNRQFLDIRFDYKNGVLEIPCVRLDDQFVCLIRNLIALEQSLYVGDAYITDFFVILDFLIDTSKDVDLLCDKGILVNYLGDSNAAASSVNSLNTNILRDYMNLNYTIICEDLNAFYKKRWHKWRTTLWRQYFSTPWRFVSTSAAIILLLLTAIQTICSLKSTKW